MSSNSTISNHGDGPQNVKTGDGPQHNNNGGGVQFIGSNIHGISFKDQKDDEAERRRKEEEMFKKEEERREREEERLKKEKEDCLRSLVYRNIDARKNDISSAHPETCDWFFETGEFQQWRDRVGLSNHNGVLWIKGHPGTGKSTLMKHTLKYCEEKLSESYMIIAHFFNARGDSFEKTPLGMIRSLLYQLLDKESSIYERFVPVFRENQKKYGENWDWQESEMKSFFISEIKRCQSKPLLLLVDALDECEETHVRDVVGFLETLSTSAIESETTLSICLSSRHYPSIRMKKHLQLTVEEMRGHNNDIITYTHAKLMTTDDGIQQGILEKASGVFMWVVLVIEMLNRAYDEGKVEAMRQKLNEVPKGLDDVFDTLLNKNKPEKDKPEKDHTDMQETILMFQLVVCAQRPLSPEELFSAVMAKSDAKSVETFETSKMTPDAIRRRITHASKGLIEVRTDGKTVQFIHESVNDFLIRNNRLQRLDPTLESNPIGRSHERLSCFCVSYIMMDVFQSPKTRVQVKNLESSYPFLKYASIFVLRHAEEAGRRGIEQAKFLQGLEEKNDKFERLRLFHNSFEAYTGSGCVRGVNLLYMLAIHGYYSLAETFLEKDANVDAQGGLYGTVLQAAAAKDKVEIITILLNKGANINAQGGMFGTALQAAAYKNNKEVVLTLLEHGASVDIRGGILGTALQAAAFEGNEEIALLLLEYGANINIQGGVIGTALQAAAYRKRKEIVLTLLEHGANVDVQGTILGTALHIAALIGGNEKIALMLLEHGANVNIQGGPHGTALQAAAFNGHEKIALVLLERGADVNIQGGRHSTALQAAALKGKEEIVSMLLERGAAVNIQGGLHGTALQAAAFKGNEEIVSMLLERGADVNIQGELHGTELQAAIPKGSKEIIAVLLKERLDDSTRSIMLDALSDMEGGEIAGLLFKERAKTNNQEIFDAALIVCAVDGQTDAIAMLLENGANVNARAFLGSALQMAVFNGWGEIIALLLENGADINAQEHMCKTETKAQVHLYQVVGLLLGLFLIVLKQFIR